MKNLVLVSFLFSLTPGLRAGPVADHGALRVESGRIVGTDGRAVSLAGNSFFWSQWMGRFYNAGVVNWLASDWKCSVVRIAMGVEAKGYLANPATEKARVETVLDAAIAADLYAIIDWHDHHACQHADAAVAFFQEMARKYGRRPNVIYEIFNEPMADVTWHGDVKPYAEKVIAAIRAIDPQHLILVGSPHWSQDVDIAAADPIAGTNLAYTLHFYAGSHRQGLRDKALVALGKGIPLFVTEWGTCNADGNGPVDAAETKAWMDFLREHRLSHCNWSISDKVESASILNPGAPSNGGWTDTDLTPSGRLVRQGMRTWAENPPTAGK